MVATARRRPDAALLLRTPESDGLVRRTYGPHEVDAFAAYCDELERCYLIPFDHVPRGGSLQLRLAKSQNNQQIGLRWAARYELAATLAEIAGP